MGLRTVNDMAGAVRGRRRALGLSQAALAARAGLSRKWVSEFERGKPGVEMSAVLQVLDALGLVVQIEARAASPAASGKPEGGLVDLDAHLATYAAGIAHVVPGDEQVTA